MLRKYGEGDNIITVTDNIEDIYFSGNEFFDCYTESDMKLYARFYHEIQLLILKYRKHIFEVDYLCIQSPSGWAMILLEGPDLTYIYFTLDENNKLINSMNLNYFTTQSDMVRDMLFDDLEIQPSLSYDLFYVEKWKNNKTFIEK